MEQKPARLPELLAPAGSEDSLRAALAAGADAVYFGGTSFSNRMRAKNFTDDGLADAIRLCHSAGARAHITVNTRIRDREEDDVLALCEKILGSPSPDARADAIICTDFGVAGKIKKRWPHAVLHASTQTSLSSPADCIELAKLGFSRLVVPRELSKAEITALCEEGRKNGFEIEMFLHGAHCVSLSGQCLLSYVMGGRSGNRGECAQPCRLPFTVSAEAEGAESTQTPLSLADMCLAGRIPEVIGTGVVSLKLEGRLKPAGYVYGVTSLYRRLLDERRSADKNEIRALEELFTRGFTDGYFTGKYAAMGGRTASESPAKSDINSEISRKLKQRLARKDTPDAEKPLTAVFAMRKDEPLRLTLNCSGVSVTAEGEIPQTAQGRPIDEAAAARNLTKFGGTGFALPPDNMEFDMDAELWVPVSSLNALRRAALDQLLLRLENADASDETAKSAESAESAKSSESAESAESAESSESAESAESAKSTEPAKSAGQAETARPFASAPRVSDKPAGKQFRTAELADFSLLPAFTADELREFAGYFRRIYVPYDRAAEALDLIRALSAEDPAEDQAADPGENAAACEIGGVLPPLTPNDGSTRAILRSLKNAGVRRALCHTPGQLALARDEGLTGDLSFRANITGTAALQTWRSTGLFASVQLSPELPEGALRAIGDHALPGALRNPAGAVVYGKIPVMTLSRCLFCGGKCRKGNAGGRKDTAKPHSCQAVLEDRRGERFPMFSLPDCETLICNSVPIWAGDRLSALKPLSFLSFFFTDESPAAALRVLRAYRDGLPGTGRRL